jgi:hypothetical protein
MNVRGRNIKTDTEDVGEGVWNGFNWLRIVSNCRFHNRRGKGKGKGKVVSALNSGPRHENVLVSGGIAPSIL